MKNAGHGLNPDGSVRGVAGMTPIVASRVQAMAGIFHPFVSLCFHCIFVPGHIASCLNALEQYLLQSRTKDSCKAAICLTCYASPSESRDERSEWEGIAWWQSCENLGS